MSDIESHGELHRLQWAARGVVAHVMDTDLAEYLNATEADAIATLGHIMGETEAARNFMLAWAERESDLLARYEDFADVLERWGILIELDDTLGYFDSWLEPLWPEPTGRD